jgi:hypothetical protein
VSLFTGTPVLTTSPLQASVFEALQPISWATWMLIILIATIYIIRKKIFNHRKIESGPTWGCGYVAPGFKQQYTASSFVRTYSKLFAPALLVEKEEEIIHGVFPGKVKYHTHIHDKVEKWLIDPILKVYKKFMARFVFLNNGKLQFYILYGIIFVMMVLGIPFVYQGIISFIEILKLL